MERQTSSGTARCPPGGGPLGAEEPLRALRARALRELGAPRHHRARNSEALAPEKVRYSDTAPTIMQELLASGSE